MAQNIIVIGTNKFFPNQVRKNLTVQTSDLLSVIPRTLLVIYKILFPIICTQQKVILSTRLTT